MSLEEFRENVKGITKAEKTEEHKAEEFLANASDIKGIQVLGKNMPDNGHKP